MVARSKNTSHTSHLTLRKRVGGYMKKIVQRMCIGCGTKKDKRELVRIVMNKSGQISLDKTGKLEGRGAYICDNIECLEKAIKAKKFEKVFNKKIDEEIYKKLRGVIIGKEN